MKNVYGLIRRLGVTSKYKGYYYLVEAISIAMAQEDRHIRITKDIYPYLARKYITTPSNIERDMRTVISACWKMNKTGLDEIAGYELSYKPTNSEFIDMVAYYLLEENTAQANVV